MHLSLCLLTAQRSSQEKPAPCEGQQQRHWGPEPTDRHCFLMSQCRTLQISFGIGARAVVMAWSNSDSFAESRVNVWEMFYAKIWLLKKGRSMKWVKEKTSKWLPLHSIIGSLQYHSIEILPQVNALFLWSALFFNHTIVPATAVCSGVHQILSVIWIICLPSVAPSKGPQEHN